MNYYSDEDVASDLQMFADRLEAELRKLERVDTLPHSYKARDYLVEIKARQKAAEILFPIQRTFADSAEAHRQQARIEAKESQEESPPSVPMFYNY